MSPFRPTGSCTNAIRLPFGDHAGSIEWPSRLTFRAPIPFADITKINPRRENAIRLPSGDQAGSWLCPSLVSFISPVPSAITLNRLPPFSNANRPSPPGKAAQALLAETRLPSTVIKATRPTMRLFKLPTSGANLTPLPRTCIDHSWRPQPPYRSPRARGNARAVAEPGTLRAHQRGLWATTIGG